MVLLIRHSLTYSFYLEEIDAFGGIHKVRSPLLVETADRLNELAGCRIAGRAWRIE